MLNCLKICNEFNSYNHNTFLRFEFTDIIKRPLSKSFGYSDKFTQNRPILKSFVLILEDFYNHFISKQF